MRYGLQITLGTVLVCLVTLAPLANADTAELIAALGSDDAAERHAAIDQLRADPDEAAPALIEALSHENAQVRAYAAYALGTMGDAAGDAVPALAEAVTDENDLVRGAAVGALRKLKPKPEVIVPLMSEALAHADPEVVLGALHSLAENAEEGVPALVEALKDPQAAFWATIVAQEIGPKAAAAVPALTDLLAHEEPEVRMHAILALGSIGPASKDSAAAVAERLTSDDENAVKYAAAYALSQIGGTAGDDALQQAIESDDEFLRLVSAFSYSELHPDDAAADQQAVELIIAGLKSDDPRVRSAAARGLAEIDAPSEIVAPAVTAALENLDHEVVVNVMAELAEQGPAAVPRLIKGLSNPDLRTLAAGVIARIGPDAKDAVPALVESLATGDPDFKREAQLALASIGPAAASAVPALIESLSSENDRVKGSACYALGSIGPAASEANKPLAKLFKDSDGFLKMASIWALLKINPGHEKVTTAAIPILIKGLTDVRPQVRYEVVTALGNIGPKAEPALPELRKLADDPDPVVAKAAKQAVEKIGG